MDVLREIPIVKCSGENLRSRRVPFVRSTFDWAVCSEPLAGLRRTRAYGYSMVSGRSVVGGKLELGPKWAVDILTTIIIFGRIQVSESEKKSPRNAKTHVSGACPGRIP